MKVYLITIGEAMKNHILISRNEIAGGEKYAESKDVVNSDANPEMVAKRRKWEKLQDDKLIDDFIGAGFNERFVDL